MQNIATIYFLQATASKCVVNWHIIILIIIMIATGIFGGYLNYLNSFDVDTTSSTNPPTEEEKKRAAFKYKLLGIGAAFLVPAFLQMINSNLIDPAKTGDTIDINIKYLIFTGFCLVAAMFSRRFITSIADKVLEAAKKAEITAKESKQVAAEADKKATEVKQVAEDAGKTAEEAKKDATTAKEKATSAHEEVVNATEEAKDVKQQINLQAQSSAAPAARAVLTDDEKKDLISLVQSFKEKTNISDYKERIKVKGDFRRGIADTIVKKNLSKTDLFDIDKSEAMLLGIAYSMQLRPEEGDVELLNKVSQEATEMYTRYTILKSYDTLISSLTLTDDQVKNIYAAISNFGDKADAGLLDKIKETKNKLQVGFPGVQPLQQ